MRTDNFKAEVVLAVIFLLLSIWMIFVWIPAQISLSATWSTVDSGVNSRTFPYFAAIIMGGAALVQLGNVLRKYIIRKKKGQASGSGLIQWANEIRAVAVFAVCVLYGILFIKIGYILATLIAPPLILAILGDRKWPHYAIVYGVGAVMYCIFQFLLKIRLP